MRIKGNEIQMTRRYYIESVLPQLKLPLSDQYPLLRLDDHPAYHSLAQHRIVMLVALTGTGKSTTLKALRQMLGGAGMDVIPTRREVADWIAIPSVQVMRGQPLRQISDRVQRFQHTKAFAERVPGGMATAFSWLQLANSCDNLLLAEGIRGPEEIGHTLRHFPRWTIIELSLHPLTRLRRLSARDDRFDQAAGQADLSFLPHDLQREAETLLAAGEITASALNIMAAEASNYGIYPYTEGAGFSNYHCLPIDGMTPVDVAKMTQQIIAETQNANH